MIFKYKAYDNLLLELGRNDYVVEITELATRDFLNTIKNSSSPQELVKSKCEKYGIMVSFDKSNNFYNQIILSHIASVYHYAETFLYELQIEYNSFSTEKWKFHQDSKRKDKTKLDQTLAFFTEKKRFNQTDKIEAYLIDTFNYYHQLRVFYSHKTTVPLGEISRKWNDAKSHFEKDDVLQKKYKIISKPKEIENLDFEDFFLFTQITKDLCLKISSLCFPEPEGLAEISEVKKLKKHTDIEKRKNRIESYLKTNFGYIRENDSDILADEINKYL
ncbi:MAG: hypothetical protein RLZZ540_1006 [Bacteroidota bacterium]|jgi:hypothetical protein